MHTKFFKKHIPIPLMLNEDYIFQKVVYMAHEKCPSLISIKEYNGKTFYGIHLESKDKTAEKYVRDEFLQYINDHAIEYLVVTCDEIEIACLWDAISMGSTVLPEEIVVMDPTKYGQYFILLRGDKANRKNIKAATKNLASIIKGMKKMAKAYKTAEILDEE